MDVTNQPTATEDRTESSYTFEINKKGDDDNSAMLTLGDADPLTRRLMMAQPSRNLKNKCLYFLNHLLHAIPFYYIVFGVGILNLPAIGIVLAVWVQISCVGRLYHPSLCKQGTVFYKSIFANKQSLEYFSKRAKKSMWKMQIQQFVMNNIVIVLVVLPIFGTETFGTYNDIILGCFWVTSNVTTVVKLFQNATTDCFQKIFSEQRKECTQSYLVSVQNTLLDNEIGTDEMLKRLTKEQRKVETYAREANKGLAPFLSVRVIQVGVFLCIMLISAALVSTSTTTTMGNKLRSLAVLCFFTMLITFGCIQILKQITSSNKIWNESIQKHLNDASLAPTINKLFGRRDDFDKWLNAHEMSAQRVFGSKVSMERLGQLGSLMLSGVVVAIYFLMRDELRNLL